MALALVVLPYTGVYYWLGATAHALAVLAIAPIYASVPALNRMGFYRTSRILLLTCYNLAVFVYAATLGRGSGTQFLFFPAAAFALIIFSRREVVSMGIMLVLPVVLFTLLVVSDYSLLSARFMPYEVAKPLYLAILYTSFVLLAAPVFYLAYWSEKAEGTLEDQVGQLRTLAESIPQQVWSALPTGELDYFSGSCLSYFARTYDEMVGWGWKDVLHPDDLPKCVEKWTHALQTGTDYEIEFRLRRASDGCYRWHLGRAVPVRNASGAIIKWFGTNTDIHDKKLAEELIAQQQITLISSSKLSALGEMAGNIAHEINNPLAIIQGKAAHIREKGTAGTLSTEWLLDAARKIEMTALRISRIVRSLRSISRDGSLTSPEPASLKAIIDDTLELCRERFRSHEIELIIEDFPSQLVVECRPVQLCQVLLNLLNNAHDAVENLPQKWVRISVIEEHDRVRLVVTDSGTGIAPEVRSKLFEPFFTTKEVGKGTGLGLSVARGLMAVNGGELELDPTAPNTRFIMSIPKRRASRLEMAA